jgi:hypothetical protein
VWALLPALPASKVAGTYLGDMVVLDVDATLVTSHSEKEAAAPTSKGGFGYHPLAVWCDNSQEMLAVSLRPGNAGANTRHRSRPSRLVSKSVAAAGSLRVSLHWCIFPISCHVWAVSPRR